MPAEPLIEAQLLSTAAEVLDLQERLTVARERLDELLKKAPDSLARAVTSAVKDGCSHPCPLRGNRHSLLTLGAAWDQDQPRPA